MKIKAILILLLITLFFSFKTYAFNQNAIHENNAYKNHLKFSTIKEEITNFLYNELNDRYQGKLIIDIKDIDSGIHLKSCKDKLMYSFANYNEIGQRTLVKVLCNDYNAWKLYVPVNLKVINDVVVTNKPISKGNLITKDDLTIQKLNILKLYNGFFSSTKNIIGKILKSPIRAGTIINPKLLTNPKIIKRGEIIKISYKSKLFNIKAKGKALQAGALNDIIRVKNLNSKKIIEGFVIAKGEISVE